MKKLFGTDGIRGEAGKYPLDPETVVHVGSALARTLESQEGIEAPRILVGRDTRESGEWIERTLACGASRQGAVCVAAGVIPTPGVAYLTRIGGFAAGVMISASHNQYSDNGIKVFSANGYKLPDEEEAEMERLIIAGEGGEAPEKPPALAEPAGLVENYVRFLQDSGAEDVRLDGMRIVVDCANGASCRIGPEVLRLLGADVTAMFDEPDGLNINHGCGSLYPDGLARTVVERGADVGVTFDGDADRTLFVSPDGRVADGDVLIFEAASHMKDKGLLKNDLVVSTVMSNLWLERALTERGIRMTRTQVGDKYVLEEMVRSGAVLGGEQSGHIIFADKATTGDGIMTAVRLLEVLQTRGETVSDWLSRVKAYPQLLLNVRVAERPDLETHPVIGVEARKVRSELGESGRLVLRYSGTEPLARVMIEAADADQVETLARRLADVIDKEIGAR
jgi:phosphoglucosamine mutase